MKYTRLARSKRGLGKWHTLWLGDDHLLSVESTGYSEEYTRYYLKEIQAVITRRNYFGKVLNVIFGLLIVIPLVAAYVWYKDGLSPEALSMGIFAGIFLPFLCWNLFRGPTCRCYIRTPLGIWELPALDRVKLVIKALTRLRPLLGQLQGEISREEIAALSKAAMEAPPTAQVAKPAPSIPQPNPGNIASTYRGGAHRAAFLLLIVEGTLSALQMFNNSKIMVYLSVFVGIMFLLLVVTALIKQKERTVSPWAGRMAWGGVVTMVSGSTIGYFFMVFLSFEKFKSGITTQNEILDLYAALDPADHPSYAYFLLAYALLVAVIGIAGLIVMERGRGTAGERQT